MAIATVVIPCGEKHIPLLYRAVRSAYAQTAPVEVLVYIDRERRGPAYGRNRLAEQVTTPFIVQLDADDWLLPHAVETWLAHWKPGTYVTSDWYQGTHHVKAVSCYGLRVNEGEANFHLPPSLFPTAYWQKLGGQDETLFGAEDTEFFFKANAARIGHKVVREPLFHYTPDGYRSKEASSDPRWQDLLNDLFSKYLWRMSMGCCGNIGEIDNTLKVGACVEGDLVVSPTWKADQKTRGRATGRNYGKINRSNTLCIDPRDYAANQGEWTVHQNWGALAPTQAAIKAALAVDPNDPVAVMAAKIAKAGIRTSWEPVVTTGYDIQQTPKEIAAFLVWADQHGVESVLEIGTGSSAGLARFMVKDMGWKVTSLDMNTPDAHDDLIGSDNWTFIQADSQATNTIELLKDQKFDLVFIDGDHSYEGAKHDHLTYGKLGRIVAMHDVADGGWWEGSTQYWKDIAYTKAGNLRKNYHEAIEPLAKQGIGWYEND
jgi:predicted O-methyltransferase YrrM